MGFQNEILDKQYLLIFNPFAETKGCNEVELLFSGEIKSIADKLKEFKVGLDGSRNNLKEMNKIISDEYFLSFTALEIECYSEELLQRNPLEAIYNLFHKNMYASTLNSFTGQDLNQRLSQNASYFLRTSVFFLKYLAFLSYLHKNKSNYSAQEYNSNKIILTRQISLFYGLAISNLFSLGISEHFQTDTKTLGGISKGKKFSKCKNFVEGLYEKSNKSLSNKALANDFHRKALNEFHEDGVPSVDTIRTEWIPKFNKKVEGS